MANEPHSAEWFGEQRDYWWNRDFLDLMAARWRLHEAASLADIGCGLGHWSRLLYLYFWNYLGEQNAITDGTFHATGGSLSYLVSARKP